MDASPSCGRLCDALSARARRTRGVDAKEYTDFLWSLFRKIANGDPPDNTFWKEDCDITYCPLDDDDDDGDKAVAEITGGMGGMDSMGGASGMGGGLGGMGAGGKESPMRKVSFTPTADEPLEVIDMESLPAGERNEQRRSVAKR